MDLRNCPKCNRVFAYTGRELCSRCAKRDESDFERVKNYLYDNPGATMTEVSEETKVDEKQILRYLREGRIEIREDDNLLLDCERCGTSIRAGRFCESCVIEMKKEFTAVLRPQKEDIKAKDLGRYGGKMHIAEMRRKLK